MRNARQVCAERYFEHLADVEALDCPKVRVAPEEHAWHLFPLKLTGASGISRNHVVQRMAAMGVGCSVHYKPLHRLSYYQQRYNLTPTDFPNAEMTWQNTFSLPIYNLLTQKDQVYVCNALKMILEELH